MTNDLEVGSLGIAVILSVIGLFIGSFLATLVLRLPNGRPVVFARSCCDSCDKVLHPWQLIPIAGWLIQKGRCYSCGEEISLFYPFMELTAAVVSLWATMSVASSILLPTLVLGWILLALAVMDYRYLRLSDVLTLSLLIFGLAVSWYLWPETLFDHLLGVIAGAGSVGLIEISYRRLRHRSGLGLGDVKLSGAAGAWLGWQALPSVMFIATAAALLVIFAGQCLGHKMRWDTKVAFGSYLCLGTWIVWLYGPITWG